MEINETANLKSSDDTANAIYDAIEETKSIYTILPIINALGQQPSINISKTISEYLDVLEALSKNKEALNSLEKSEVLKPLVSVVSSMLESIMSLYTILITLHFMHFRGTPFGYDDVNKMVNQLDMNNLIHKENETDAVSLKLDKLGIYSNTAKNKLKQIKIDFEENKDLWKKYSLDTFINENQELLNNLNIDTIYFDKEEDPVYKKYMSGSDNLFSVIDNLNSELYNAEVEKENTDTSTFLENKTIDTSK